MFRLLTRRRSGPLGSTLRIAVEQLEARTLPSRVATPTPPVIQANPPPVAAPTVTAPPPVAAGAPWSRKANPVFVKAQSPDMLQAMYFNSGGSYAEYVSYFRGRLRRWTADADAAGILDDAGLKEFLHARLDAYFPQARTFLEATYPGLSEAGYRALMAMNLAHGYYDYAAEPLADGSAHTLLHMRRGACDDIAGLLRLLLQAQDIPAGEIVQHYNYRTRLGRFVASHATTFAAGLWLDAEINIAFAVDLGALRRIPAERRLAQLVDSHRVYGFYNWYLQPQVRADQLRRGLDGGIIAFYYQYYFAGIGAGASRIRLVPEVL